jgi:hypothetical protein
MECYFARAEIPCPVTRRSAHCVAFGAASQDVLLVDMPAAARAHRVYDHYLAELARTDPEELAVCAFSVVGSRERGIRPGIGLRRPECR